MSWWNRASNWYASTLEKLVYVWHCSRFIDNVLRLDLSVLLLHCWRSTVIAYWPNPMTSLFKKKKRNILSTMQDLIPGAMSCFLTISFLLHPIIRTSTLLSLLAPFVYSSILIIEIPWIACPVIILPVVCTLSPRSLISCMCHGFILGMDVSPEHRCMFLFTGILSMGVSHQHLESNCYPVPNLLLPILLFLSAVSNVIHLDTQTRNHSSVFCAILPPTFLLGCVLYLVPLPSATATGSGILQWTEKWGPSFCTLLLSVPTSINSLFYFEANFFEIHELNYVFS